MSLKRRMYRPTCWMGALAAAAISIPSAHAIVNADAPLSDPGIMSFLAGEARLIITRTDGSFGCSGSLLSGGAYVLTAAHCVSGDSGTAKSSNISLSFGAVAASSSTYYVNPGWNGNAWAGNDLALIKLNNTVSSIPGYSLSSSNSQGSQILIAGYGDTGTGSTGYVDNTFGTLHYGSNELDGGADYPKGVSPDLIYLYDFDSGSQATNLFGSTGLGANEATIAPGDSGGGSFVLVNSVWELASVHSFIGCHGINCTLRSSFGDYAGDVSVAGNMAWLNTFLAPVPEPETYAMLMAGLGILGAIGRRSKSRAASSPVAGCPGILVAVP